MFYEYARAAGVTCFFDHAEEFLLKSLALDEEDAGRALRREGEAFRPRSEWTAALARNSEGSQCTLGAFSRPWK